MEELLEKKAERIASSMAKHFVEFGLKYLLFQEFRRQGGIDIGFAEFRRLYMHEMETNKMNNPLASCLPDFMKEMVGSMLSQLCNNVLDDFEKDIKEMAKNYAQD